MKSWRRRSKDKELIKRDFCASSYLVFEIQSGLDSQFGSSSTSGIHPVNHNLCKYCPSQGKPEDTLPSEGFKPRPQLATYGFGITGMGLSTVRKYTERLQQKFFGISVLLCVSLIGKNTVKRLRFQQKTKELLSIANVTGQLISYPHGSNIAKTGATNTCYLKTKIKTFKFEELTKYS